MPIVIDPPSATDFNPDRSEIIKRALRMANALAFGQEPPASLAYVANEALNAYLKHLMTRGPHLWRHAEGVLFLVEGEQSYDLGIDGDHSAFASDFISTTLSADAAAAATALSVASTAGMVVDDAIGIELADGTRQWTTIAAIPGSGSLTVNDALIGATESGATVYTYTTLLQRPVRITSIRRRVNGSDTTIDLVSRQEYFDQADKASSGKINMAYYDRQLRTGKLYIWPTADNVEDTLRFTFERTITDMDANGETLDVPAEGVEAVCFGLAYRLAIELGRPPAKIMQLKNAADESEAHLLAFDQEDASVFISPDSR